MNEYICTHSAHHIQHTMKASIEYPYCSRVLLIIGIFCWGIVDDLYRIKRDDHEKSTAAMTDVYAEAEGSVL